MRIDAAYECGNIEVLKIDGAAADLAIRPDAPGPWLQWFDFQVLEAAGRDLTLRIVNAGQASYPAGWPGYRACVSEDGETWLRADTRYRDGVLEIRHRPATNAARFAYFAPYDLSRHRALLARAAAAPGVTSKELGRSVEGRAVDCLTLGEGEAPIWIIGRQHSGETMASWWMEGAFARLLDPADSVAAELRRRARLHIVPLVNIDGAARGHLRGNAAGIDLNRQWAGPDPKDAPEVAAVLGAMEKTGVVISLDVHGDEALPHVFIEATDADQGAGEAAVAGVAAFKSALLGLNPAFQIKIGYPKSFGGTQAPRICTRALCLRFGAAAMTLEMPFKDSLEAPDPREGWSVGASMRMGHDCIEAMLAALDAVG